jgi:hypothetical protein
MPTNTGSSPPEKKGAAHLVKTRGRRLMKILLAGSHTSRQR